MAQQIDRQHQQADQRTYRHTGDGTGGSDVGAVAPAQQQPRQAQAHQQLAQRFDDLAGGSGLHIALPLRIAADGGDQTHTQHTGRQRQNSGSGLTVVQKNSQLPRDQQHHAAAHCADGKKQHQCYAEHPPPLIHTPQRVSLRHQARQRQRQTGSGQDHQQIIDVVGHIEVRHSLFVQEVAQRDLIQCTDDLGHSNSRSQNRRTGHKVLPPLLCHKLPLSRCSTSKRRGA